MRNRKLLGYYKVKELGLKMFGRFMLWVEVSCSLLGMRVLKWSGYLLLIKRSLEVLVRGVRLDYFESVEVGEERYVKRMMGNDDT